MQDQLLQWIRFSVATSIGAAVTAALSSFGVIDQQLVAEASSAIQTLVTVAVYVAITAAAARWPVVNRVLSLFLSNRGPAYHLDEK